MSKEASRAPEDTYLPTFCVELLAPFIGRVSAGRISVLLVAKGLCPPPHGKDCGDGDLVGTRDSPMEHRRVLGTASWLPMKW